MTAPTRDAVGAVDDHQLDLHRQRLPDDRAIR